VDPRIHELGGRPSGVGSMSCVELRPGARPFVPQRDLLSGGPSDQRRHRLARVVLLDRLLREAMVLNAFDDWATQHGLRQPMETLTTRLDTLAFDAGLSSRTALFPPKSTLDASTQQAVHQALEAFWSGVTGNGVELGQDAHRLTEQLVTALGLSAGCMSWLTLELLSWFLDSIRAEIEDRAVTRSYTEEPFPEVITVRIDPGLSARQRSCAMRQQMDIQLAAAREQSTGTEKKMPNRGGEHISAYVEWLVQHRLHGVPVAALARALLRSEGDVLRSSHYDARHRVQYGIRQARTWLAAVAHTPSSRPAQPRHRTTRKRSTRGRRKRSAPR
jgi:hypothetical protein